MSLKFARFHEALLGICLDHQVNLSILPGGDALIVSDYNEDEGALIDARVEDYTEAPE